VEVLPQILPVEDTENIEICPQGRSRKQGIKILTNTNVTKLDRRAHSVIATIDDGKGKLQTVEVGPG